MSHWWMIFFTVLSVDADMNLCSCSLQGKFAMDSSGDLAKGICTDILQKGIRQQCWRLKKLYWKDVSGLPREQALLLKPKEVDEQSWADLLNIWHDEHYKVHDSYCFSYIYRRHTTVLWNTKFMHLYIGNLQD
jgi:hypothetical protein